MFSSKRCLLGIGLAIFGCAAGIAAPPLTVVQDLLFNADGTRFTGIATISWQSFEASDMSNVPAHTITTQIVNGLLRVQLVPTTNALSPASYSVVYNSDGNVQFAENWAVPPSNVPVRVRDIRIGGAGSIIGSGGGTPPPVLSTVNIADVVGLSSALNLRPTLGAGYAPSRAAVIDGTGALNAAIGGTSDCLHVDGSSAPCGGTVSGSAGPVFVDGEIPAGSPDGVNASFTLGSTPSPLMSLSLYRNGVLVRQGSDYNLSGARINFVSGQIPRPNDILIASYRMGSSPTGYSFVDAETPAGPIDGGNTIFGLTQSPTPQSSLALYRNGLRLRANLDYVLSSTSIIFQAGLAPQPGDILLCSYRSAGSN